ncbi:MAG: Smr/MutS family protein [Pseudomonadota bacterium]
MKRSTERGRPARLSAEEAKLFRAAMVGAAPMAKGAPRRPLALAPPADASARPAPHPAAPAASVPAAANPGIDRRTAERLRKGEIPIARRLDLHGLTQEIAHRALDRCVASAFADGQRLLLVITGRGRVSEGGGVLRAMVPRWLAAGDNAAKVLRVEAAQPRHGGAGAYYVLLRRRREAEEL